jgi:hypothetical protein
MADAHGLAGGGGSSARGRTANGKLYLPNAAFTFAPECACGGGRATEWVYRLAAPRGVAIAPLAKSVRRALGVQRRKAA